MMQTSLWVSCSGGRLIVNVTRRTGLTGTAVLCQAAEHSVGDVRVGRGTTFPQSGRELGNSRGRVFTHALKYVDQVRIRVDLLHAAGHDQALHDVDMAGAELRPAEQEIPASHRNHAQCALQMIRVD